MLNDRSKFIALIGGAAIAAAVSFGAAGSAYACGDGSCEPPPTETTKANNGYGQEKHGAVQDGENAGSDKGKGVPQGGPGGGDSGAVTKQDGSPLR
jgi:hypothetical protein